MDTFFLIHRCVLSLRVEGKGPSPRAAVAAAFARAAGLARDDVAARQADDADPEVGERRGRVGAVPRAGAVRFARLVPREEVLRFVPLPVSTLTSR